MPIMTFQVSDGQFGKVMKLREEWTDDVLPYVRSNSIEELVLRKLSSSKWYSLSFLDHFVSIKALRLFGDLTTNINPIHQLHNLVCLQLYEHSEEPIDFGAFPCLDQCTINFSKNRNSISQCANLTYVHLQGYSYKDLTRLEPLKNLTTLKLAQGPITDIASVTSFPNLNCLDLAFLRNMSDISPISTLSNIETLSLVNCKAITSLDAISSLRKLRHLSFSNCGVIDSISPIASCRELESVNFTEGTIIKDGDLRVLLNLPKLRRVGFANRSHYNLTLAQALEHIKSEGK